MKQIWVVFLLMSANIGSANVPIDSLQQLQWCNRLVLVIKPISVAQTQEKLSKQNSALQERDVIWFVIGETTFSTSYSGDVSEDLPQRLRKKFPTEQQKVLLIGKDGEVKSTRADLDFPSLYAEIDGMPMRKREKAAQNRSEQ